MAMSLDDLLARRIRLVHMLPDRGASIAARVAEIAGHGLGWAAERQAAEVSAYLDNARREFGVPG
jgi:glycerol-3-phosphate dehydrogenase